MFANARGLGRVLLVGGSILSTAWAVGPAAAPHAVGELRLIGVRTLPLHQAFQGTVIGGLSGLDYRPATDEWISETDDKSEYGPTRFYTLRLRYDEKAFRLAEPTAVAFFRQPDGTVYPDRAHALAHGGEIPDFESIRFDPGDGSVWYASEGDRSLNMSPFVRHAARDGRFLFTLPQPPMFRLHPDREAGPRHNLSFEGLTFSPDGQTLWVGMEAPLYEDGPVPTVKAGAVSRLTHYDRAGKILGQFAYPLDAIPVLPATGGLADNGVSEMLAVTDHQFLLVERSGSQDGAGLFHFQIRLYEADISGATEVSGIAALAGASYRPVSKRLVANLNLLGQPWVDNLEGVAWGPRLPNGHDSLVLVSDDNFSEHQQTQFWAFEVLPPVASRPWDQGFAGVVHDSASIRGFVGEDRWLSNFLACRVEWEGRVYGSSEAAYQSAKYPAGERDAFTTLDPDAAKQLSRARPYDTAAWERRKESAMREIVWAKFSQHPDLAANLLATDHKLLEETNWWGDAIWGVYQGRGQNLLGHILMETRERLRTAAKSP